MPDKRVEDDGELQVVKAVEPFEVNDIDADLSCPVPREEPPVAVAVDVQVGGPWIADPNPHRVSDAQLEMVLTNVGDESIRPVVISIDGGDPTNPPIVDGVVDLSQSGVSDANSSLAAFGLEYPDVEAIFTQGDSRVAGEVPFLDPGDSVAISVFGSGPFVIFDYRQGEFQAGSLVVIDH